MAYTIGLDYGTNSVRCLIVDVTNGNEVGTAVHNYETGQAGIIIDPAGRLHKRLPGNNQGSRQEGQKGR